LICLLRFESKHIKEEFLQVKTVYIDTQIPAVDQPLKEEFAEYTTEDRDQADILVLSKKSVESGDLTRLAAYPAGRRIMFLADSKDTELINEAKAVGVKDIFYSPVKLPPLIDRIEEALAQTSDNNQPQDIGIQSVPAPHQKPPAKEAGDNTTDELNGLLQAIKGRMTNSEEIQVLRSENEELRIKIKKYEDFIAVLKEIFVSGGA
jgi:DNA-binding NarL/FixJ family response regulator